MMSILTPLLALFRPTRPATAPPACPEPPSKIFCSIIRPVSEGTELTDFVEVRDGERWQSSDGLEHVEKHGHRLLAAKAVSKILIPEKPDAAARVRMPLADDTGAVEALDHHGDLVRAVFIGSHARKPIQPPL